MAPIKVKEIVRFSSQDNNHPVENLLKVQTQWNRWLCAPDDKSGCLQAELQLEKSDCIGFIDIGNYGSSMVEIQVRKSYSSEGDFQTLLPATLFRTIKESRDGLNKNGVRMFNGEHFVEGVRDKQWDRIKIVCRELSKKNQQFGLAFISFSSAQNKSEQQIQKETVSREEPKVTGMKKAKISKVINPVPSWKKNAAFYCQYMERNLKSNSGQSELKEKILKMSATAEDGFTHEESFSRSAKMLLASSGGSSTPQGVTDYAVCVDTSPPEEVRDSLIQFKKKLQAFIQAEGPGIATASMKGLRSKFVEQLGYKMDEHMKKEFKTTLLKAAEKIMSSNASPVRTSTKQVGKKDETPGSKPVEKGKAAPTKRKIFPEKRPAKAKKGKEKKLPASAYRSCPRCHEKFTAGQINLHIVTCNPNHQQIARGALAAAASSFKLSESPSASSTPTSDLGKKKKQTTKRKSKTQENQQRGSVKNMKVHPDRDANGSSAVRTQNLCEPRSFGKVLTSSPNMSYHVNEDCCDSTAPTSSGFGKGNRDEGDIVQCPICRSNFPSYVIEVHASLCGTW